MADEKVRVTLVTLTREPTDQRDLGTFTGDSSRYYLPGADYHETQKALLAAGFTVADTIQEAIDARESREQNC